MFIVTCPLLRRTVFAAKSRAHTQTSHSFYYTEKASLSMYKLILVSSSIITYKGARPERTELWIVGLRLSIFSEFVEKSQRKGQR